MSTHVLLHPDDPRLRSETGLDAARDLLAGAALVGPEAEAHRAEVLAFLDEHDDAAHRANPVGHLTGSALVVDAGSRRTLLLLHRKLGRWFQPGGHADGDTNVAAVALREAQEETGLHGLRVALPAIDVDVHVVEPPSEPAHRHLDVRFLVVAPAGAVEHGNEESLALRWVDEASMEHLDPPIDASTRRLVARGLAALDDLEPWS